MNHKTPAITASLLTIVMLILFGLLSFFLEMVILNGASEKQGTIALGFSGVCNGLSALLLGLFAGWLTKFLLTKFNWNKILAVAVAVFVSVMAGVLISFLSIIISIPVAGIQ